MHSLLVTTAAGMHYLTYNKEQNDPACRLQQNVEKGGKLGTSTSISLDS